LPNDRWIARCDDLVKVYATATSEVRALKGIDARFGEAALTVVAGPSGSGKSSLLRILAGIDHPTSGVVDVAGVRIDRPGWGGLRKFRARTVGYVFQRASDNFLPYLTLREHLVTASPSAAATSQRLGELVRALGLEDRLDHLPSELSGGEQARAAMAQVLLAGARVVIADEPTAELDTASATGLLAAMRALLDAGVSFVVASHDPALRRRADAVVELEHGMLRTREKFAEPASQSDRWSTSAWQPSTGEPDLDDIPLTRPQDILVRGLGLRKTYRRGGEAIVAVDDVSLELGAGELVGLVGRSGSGKTTLLNLLGGWERPDAGELDVAGDDASLRPPRWSDVAVVAQRLGLIDELTVRENVEYPARLAGRVESAGTRIDELLEALALGPLRDRFPAETSVGEQQRTALARALVLAPRVLLADEPTSHQDETLAGFVMGAIRRAAADGAACLVATHDDDVVGALDRTLTMADGRLAG
jgi:putative ABC transport system ATP-binding protein